MFKRFLAITILMMAAQSISAEPDVNQMLDVPSSATIQSNAQDSFLMSTAKTVGTGIKETAKTGVAVWLGVVHGFVTKHALGKSLGAGQNFMTLCNTVAASLAAKYGADLIQNLLGNFQAKAFITASACGFMAAESEGPYHEALKGNLRY